MNPGISGQFVRHSALIFVGGVITKHALLVAMGELVVVFLNALKSKGIP